MGPSRFRTRADMADRLQDFYGEELRLLVAGYVRPEADFTTLDDLRRMIHRDAEITRQALLDPTLAAWKDDESLRPVEATNAAS